MSSNANNFERLHDTDTEISSGSECEYVQTVKRARLDNDDRIPSTIGDDCIEGKSAEVEEEEVYDVDGHDSEEEDNEEGEDEDNDCSRDGHDMYTGVNEKAPPDSSDFHQHFSEDLRLAYECLQTFDTLVGKKCIGHIFNPISHSWELTLCLPLAVINSQFREWWGLTDKVVQIELTNINPILFRKREPPSVSSSLPSTVKNVATQSIDNACKAFLEKTWRVTHEDDMDPYEEDRGSYFLRLIGFIVGRLKELGNFCVQCGKKQLGAHPLLTVCDQELCVFQRDLLRRNLGSSMGPRLWSDSSELLVFLFGNANLCARRHLVLKPDPQCELNIDRLQIQKLLKTWCTRCTFSSWNSFKLFRESRPNVSNLLYWLSDRFPVVCRLPPRFQIDELLTRNQYLLPPVPSQKEERFKRAKESVGGKTFFAFHGSPVQNWYSIMCEGLQVCSGTDRQMVGAIHGNGIYMAKQPMTAAAYCGELQKTVNDQFEMPQGESCKKPDHRKSVSHLHKGTWCLGLCEVVDDRSKFTERGYGTPYYVLTDPDYVQVRVLFVYNHDSRNDIPSVKDGQLTVGGDMHKKLMAALHFFSEAPFRGRIAAILDSEANNETVPDDKDLIVLPIEGKDEEI